MHTFQSKYFQPTLLRGFTILITVLLWCAGAQAELTISVQAPDGSPVTGFRWLLEEDNTHPVTPGALVSDSLSLDIHMSYAPVVSKGHSTGSTVIFNNIATDSVLSILPDADYTIGGIKLAQGQQDVDTPVIVTVQPLPLPTARITVFVFEDTLSLNNVPDIPQEQGLGGFNVFVIDAAGQVIQDAFGNPLGTTYQVDTQGNVTYNPDGSPAVAALGDGTVLTGPDGHAEVNYLAPGKYEIQIIPPPGQGWQQ
ncbi:MAG: hypothetical protein GY809_27210, partial [Planctomycetes bacterium]|nr:hypothetical protein [Planctomycetota bacterium]